MPSYNKVILMGHLTRDIEVKTVGGGTVIGNFSLAINRKFKTQSGEQREEVCFIDCTAFGKTAEAMGQYLSKGDPVMIEGRLKQDLWEDKNGGGKRSKISITIESFQFIGGKKSDGGGNPQPAKQSQGGGSPPTFNHDDIPFSPSPLGGL